MIQQLHKRNEQTNEQTNGKLKVQTIYTAEVYDKKFSNFSPV